MATIEGSPATFVQFDKDGGQLCYARTHYKGAGVKESQMYDTRAQVTKVINKTIAWREKKGYRNDRIRYGSLPIVLGE